MRKWLVLLLMLSTIFGLFACGDTEITITFDTMGGETLEDLVVNANSTSINLPDPIKEGFTFEGWYLDEEYTEPFTITALLNNQTLTVYAKWSSEVLTYTITYETDGGTEIPSETHQAGVTITAPTPPTKAGFTFGGWFSDLGLTTSFNFNVMPASNLTLYAKWNAVVLNATMTFETNGGSVIAPITQAVGSNVTAPTAPTKAHYTFAGWYQDQALTNSYTFTTMPSSNITIYAKWTPITYTMTFESNGGNAVTAITRTVEQSSIIEPDDPIKEGYTFAGWYRESTLLTMYTFDLPILANVTLYAKWTPVNYTLTFDSKGGSEIDPMTHPYQATITAPTPPIKEGYTFDGWYLEETYDTAFQFNTMPLNGDTLYAKWIINTYTITFDTLGGNDLSDLILTFGATIQLPDDPVKVGAIFLSWYTDQGLNTPFDLENMPATNLTLYAKWEVIPYDISYIIDLETYMIQTYGLNDPIILPDEPVKEGYEFMGWYLDQTFETAFTLTTMPEEDIMLYGKMSIKSYTINFETNGGLVEDPVTHPYKTPLNISIIPLKEGFIFMGWFMDSALTKPFVNMDMPAEDITLYAKWAVDEGYDYILSIIQTEKPNVKVKGIVYYTFPSTMNPGFYLYDGTGYIFVLSPEMVEVGDTIEFEAEFSFFEYIPQLTNVTNLLENTSFNTMPTPIPMTITELYQMDPIDPTNYGKPIIITGAIDHYGMDYYLMDMMMEDPVIINYKSFMGLMPNPLEALSGSFVHMEAIIMGFEPKSEFWHIYYNHHEGATPITYTNQEKVDMLIELGMTMLDGMIFYPGQYLELPETDPFFGSTLSFELIGENQSYFDLTTGIFGETEIERLITIEFTVTVGLITATETATLYLKPLEVLTISEFLLLPYETFGIVEGVVVLHIGEAGIIVIADSTHTLLVTGGSDDVMLGDLIQVGGYLFSMDGIDVLGMDPENPFFNLKLEDQENPLTPMPLTPEAFSLLDPALPMLWLSYVEVTGTLMMDEMSPMIYISDGMHDVPLMVFDPMFMEALGSIEGLEVSISGFILPNFDGENPFLMLVFNGDPNSIAFNGSEESLVFELGGMLQAYLESLTFYPGQTIELPLEHPILPVTIVYQTESLLLDLDTLVISDTITEETWIIVEAFITIGTYTETWDVHLHVTPIVPLSIYDFMTDTSEMNQFTQGVVIFKIEEPTHQFYIIADENDILFVMTDLMLHIGDEILVYGQVYYEDGMPFVFNEDQEVVIETVLTMQDNPLIPETITIEAFNLLTPMDHMFNYYELTGVLYHMGEGAFQIKDALMNAVTIFAPTTESYEALYGLVGYEVNIKGLSITQSEHPGLILIFLNTEDTLSPTLSDEDLYLSISQTMISDYEAMVFRQGAYHKLTMYQGYVHATYNILTNATMYDLSSGYISHTISTPLTISIEVTLTVGTYEGIYTIELNIEPIETTTIHDFLFGLPDTVYQVRGYIAYSKFSFDGGVTILVDQTGYMLIPYDLDLIPGQEVILSGMKADMMGVTTISEDVLVVEIISEFGGMPLNFIPMMMSDIFLLDPEDTSHWGKQIVIEGYLVHDFTYGFMLVENLGDENGLKVSLYDYEDWMFINGVMNYEIKIYGFLMPSMEKGGIDGFMLFPYQLTDIKTIYQTDMEEIEAVIDYGTYLYESSDIETRSFIELFSYIEVFGIHVTYEIISGPSIIDFNQGFIHDVPGLTVVVLRMTLEKGDLVVSHDYTLNIKPYIVLNIPNLEATQIPGMIGGLYIQEIGYVYGFMGGTDFNVELSFPDPTQYGAEYFILEYYDEIEGIFKTFMYYDEPVISLYYDEYYDTYLNTTLFSLTLPMNTIYRLRAFNAPEALVTNQVFVGMPIIETNFSDWYHDESMFLTGIMSPEYGFGMEISTIAYDLENSINLEEGLIYKWYRVNPYTFEMTLIEGESSSLYQTRFEDVGHYIIGRIEGDGIVADGYLQLRSFDVVKIYNPAKIVSYDRNGFVVEFSHNFDPMTLENLLIFGDYEFEIEVLSITPYGAPRTYRINADLSMYDSYYIDMYEGNWFFGGYDKYHHMQGLSIYFEL